MYHILENDKKTEIEYVYHISDIHIQNKIDRHEEYLEVFERLYKTLEKMTKEEKKKSLIVITGDIMHVSSMLSPEAIFMVKNFFGNLMKILPVIIIAGNHDCDLSNKGRMDALFPLLCEDDEIYDAPIVIKKSEYNNLYYLRKSGFFRYHNIVFGMTSIYDKKIVSADDLDDELFDNMEQENKYKIALFHGGIDKSQVKSGFKICNGHVNYGDFTGYDYVMLGDIHKYQYMDKENTIAYAGSLIQQSHGESIEDHGFLKWSLIKNQTQHFDIFNEYGYCTVEITDGKLVETIPIIKPRARFILENTNQVQYKTILKQIKKDYPGLVVTGDLNKRIKKKYGHIDNQKSFMNTNNDIKHIEKIQLYAKTKKYSDNVIKTITNIHEKIYDTVTKDSKTDVGKLSSSYKGYLWEIIELKFSNILSYGEDNVIDFTNYKVNQVIGIIAPNHYGKSAIIDVILFCLFDRFSRGKKGDIMNKDKKKMYCSLCFSIGSKIYQIEKIGTRSQKDTVVVNTFFREINPETGDEEKNLTCSGKGATIKKICELVGDYDEYTITCICLQQMGKNNFIDMGQSDRKAYLQKILNINVFELCNKRAKNVIKKKVIEQKELTKQINKIDIDNVNHQINDKMELLKNIKRNLDHLNYLSSANITKEHPELTKIDELSEYNLDTHIDIENTKEMLKSELDQIIYVNDDVIKKKISNKKAKLVELNEKLHELYRKNELLTGKIININGDIESITKEKKILKNKIENNNEKLGEKNILTSDVILKKITTLKDKKKNLKIELEKCDSIDALSFLYYDNLDQNKYFEENLKKINVELNKLDLDTSDIIKKNNMMIKNIKKRKLILMKTMSKYVIPEEKYSAENTISLLGDKIENENKIQQIDDKLEELNNILDLVQKNESDNDELEKIKEMIIHYNNNQIYKNKIKDKKKKIDDIIVSQKNINEKIKQLEEQCAANNNFLQRKNKIINKLHLLDLYSFRLSEYILLKKNYIIWSNNNKETEKQIIELNREHDKLIIELKNLKKILSSYDELKKKSDNITRNIEMYTEYVKITDYRTGLPCEMIKKCLVPLSEDVNRILSSFVDFKVKFMSSDPDNDDDTISNKKNIGNIYVAIKYPDKKMINVELACGFERYIVGIAIRIALSQITMFSKPNFFIMDEGFSCMDEYNRDNVDKVINYIKELYDHVIIISHLKELKDQSDHVLTITKIGDDSNVDNKFKKYDNNEIIRKKNGQPKNKIVEI